MSESINNIKDRLIRFIREEENRLIELRYPTWMINSHKECIDNGLTAVMSTIQYTEFLVNRQTIRNKSITAINILNGINNINVLEKLGMIDVKLYFGS